MGETWAKRLNSFPGISVMMLIFLLIGNIQVVFMENTWQWHLGVSLFIFAVWVSVMIAMLLSHYKRSLPVYRHLGIFQIFLSMFYAYASLKLLSLHGQAWWARKTFGPTTHLC